MLLIIFATPDIREVIKKSLNINITSLTEPGPRKAGNYH
jgi:hypothetical protein